MNHIKRLQADREELAEQLATVRSAIEALILYYASPKFKGTDADYAYVSTDLFPNLMHLRELTQ